MAFNKNCVYSIASLLRLIDVMVIKSNVYYHQYLHTRMGTRPRNPNKQNGPGTNLFVGGEREWDRLEMQVHGAQWARRALDLR